MVSSAFWKWSRRRPPSETHDMPSHGVDEMQQRKVFRVLGHQAVRRQSPLRVLELLRQPRLEIGQLSRELRKRRLFQPGRPPIDVASARADVRSDLGPDLGDPDRVPVQVSFGFFRRHRRWSRRRRRDPVRSGTGRASELRDSPRGWVGVEPRADTLASGEEIGIRSGHAQARDPGDFEAARALVTVADCPIEQEERPERAASRLGSDWILLSGGDRATASRQRVVGICAGGEFDSISLAC